jgi:sugar O-acyltransferase (sialic acid O-acetyltransferase NeuD family)
MTQAGPVTRPLVVYGSGGHGKVVCDILMAAGEQVRGFIDDERAPGTLVLGLPILGPLAWLVANPARVALGVGDNAARARVAESCIEAGSTLASAIHPRAVVAASARVGAGAAVMALAVINPDAVVMQGAIVNTAAIVEHDCTVGEFAHVSPNACLAGGCHVDAFAHLGIGATMLPGTRIGERCIVGGGAVVVRGLPADVVASGIPARIMRVLSKNVHSPT